MTETQIELMRNIPYQSGASIQVPVTNNRSFTGIRITHNTGTLSGGSSGALIANTVLTEIGISIRGDALFAIRGDLDDDSPAMGLHLLRQFTKLTTGVAPSDESWQVDFPDLIPQGHEMLITLRWNTIGNINDGDRTTYDGTLDVYGLHDPDEDIEGLTLGAIRSHKFAFGTDSGSGIPKYLPPTIAGMETDLLMCYAEDDGTATNTGIQRIQVIRGTEIIFSARVTALQEKNRADFGVAPDDGFFLIPLETTIDASDVRLEVDIPSALTALDLHYLQIDSGDFAEDL